MHHFNRKTLTCAIAALTLGSQLVSADSSSFYEDASISGKLRTTYYDIEKSDRVNTATGAAKNSSTSGAWTAGLWIDAKSGYAWNIIGFDASVYGSTKLYMDENNSHNNQLLNDENEGISKVGQAYVKMKFGDKDFGAKFNAGRQIIYNGLISSSGSRSLPSSWQGYNLMGNAYGIQYGFAYVDKMSLRNYAGFDTLENFDGKQIDYVMGGQLRYKANGLELLYRNGFSKNFLQAHNVKVGNTFELNDDTNLTVDARYFITKEDGDLWTGYANWSNANSRNTTEATFDDKAQQLSLNAKLAMNDWTFVAAVSHTKAESEGNLGKYYYDFGKNTHGIWDSETSAFGEDFMYDGETAFKVGGEYDFGNMGIKGLVMGYSFHYGSGMKANNDESVSEHEHDFSVVYSFQQDALKGLRYKLEYGIYNNDDALRNTIGHGKRNDLRTWLDYKFVAF